MMSSIALFVKTYSTGVVSATLSVIFASYMFIHGEVETTVPAIAVTHVPVINPLVKRSTYASVPRRFEKSDINVLQLDDLVTGSIAKQQKKQTKTTRKVDLKVTRYTPVQDPTKLYVVRIATPEMALVEGLGRLWSVSPGHLLPKTGRVLEIKNEGSKWVVVTTNGNITE